MVICEKWFTNFIHISVIIHTSVKGKVCNIFKREIYQIDEADNASAEIFGIIWT